MVCWCLRWLPWTGLWTNTLGDQDSIFLNYLAPRSLWTVAFQQFTQLFWNMKTNLWLSYLFFLCFLVALAFGWDSHIKCLIKVDFRQRNTTESWIERKDRKSSTAISLYKINNTNLNCTVSLTVLPACTLPKYGLSFSSACLCLRWALPPWHTQAYAHKKTKLTKSYQRELAASSVCCVVHYMVVLLWLLFLAPVELH